MALTQTRTDAATPGGPLAVGQTVALHAAVTLPSGSSQALRIDPVLPAGLALVSATITDVTPGTAGLAAGQASASGFDLGNYTAGSTSTVGIDIVARATGGSGGAVQAVVSAADGTGGRVATSASAQVPVLSPALSLTLTGPASLQYGQSGAYTLQLTDAPGAAPAYAVQILESLDPGLTVVPGTASVSGSHAGGESSTTASGGLAVALPELDAGQSLTLTFQARAAAPAGTVLASFAEVDAASLPGGSPANQLSPVRAIAVAQVADTPPTLTGIAAGLATSDTTPAAPFAALALADSDAGQTESVTVTLSDARNGTLTNLGGGAYDPAVGIYTLAGPAALVQAALQGLLFVPTAHQAAAGGQVATGLAVAVQDGAGGGANAATPQRRSSRPTWTPCR